MKLYVIRHGQSEANIAPMHSGQTAVPLTESGRRDARHAGELLSGISFDRIYASDLLRARETAELALPEAEIELLPLLREIDVGVLGGRFFDDCLAEYGSSYEENKAKTDFRPYGGESLHELFARATAFVELLRGLPYERVCAFSHAGFLSMLLSAAVGAEPTAKPSITLPENGSVSVFEVTESDLRLLKWSYTGRLY